MILLDYSRLAEGPAARLWLEDDDGSLIDLSGIAGWELKVGRLGRPAVITKTSGITGQAGAGQEPDGTPNCVIVWADGELNVRPGDYDFQLVADDGSRVFRGRILIGDSVR